MDSNFYGQNIYQQNIHNHALSRYTSAPSSFLASLIEGCGSFGDGNNSGSDENHQNDQSSSPEIETFSGLISSSANVSDGSGSRFGDMHVKEEPNKQSLFNNESSKIYHNQEVGSGNNTTLSVLNSLGIETSVQLKTGNRSSYNLTRQSSSPAGFFSEMNIENGFDMMRNVGNFRSKSNGANGDSISSPSTGISSHLNFYRPSSSSRYMPHIAEEGSANIDGPSNQDDHISQNDKVRHKSYITNFPENSWDDSSSRSLKRAKDNNGNVFSIPNLLDIQNTDSGNHRQRLTHHLSLPINCSDMSTGEKVLRFQESVPFKVRAKRGCATHPRSIAERVRRTRISERMRKLQDLFPTMDKQTSTAEMLDLAVEFIKDLQKQVKILSDSRAKCTCSS